MHNQHTSIVSRHLATRGNNKSLRIPPPHISSFEEILPRLTRRTITQLITNKSPFLKSYLHNVDVKSHPSPLCPLCKAHTTYIISSTAPTYAPHCHHLICGQTPPAGVTALLARWTDKMAGGPHGETSDSPTSKGHGNG